MPAGSIQALTSLLAFVMALALLDQWRERRRPFQLVWAAGMLFYGIASGCEAIGATSGWNELLYRTWYLTGAMWTAGWLGLGTTFLLSRTRFGYTFAVCLLLAGRVHAPDPEEVRLPGRRQRADPVPDRGGRPRGRRRRSRPTSRTIAGRRSPARPSSGRRSSRSS